MTEQETREKIADKVYEVLRKSSKLQDGKRVLILNINGINKVAERVAYSLIFLGIGDVSKWKHRAEVAEIALQYAVSEYRCDECPCETCNADIRGSNECIDLIIEMYKKEAEKELTEEK